MESPYLQVEITMDDILFGVAGRPEACPIALAINRSQGVRRAYVSERNAIFGGKAFRLKSDAKEFVKAYNAGGNVWPQTVTLIFDGTIAD